MLVQFEGVNGQSFAVDAFDVSAILPASTKGAEVPMIGVCSIQLRGGIGLGAKGGVAENAEKVNAARASAIRAQKGEDATVPFPRKLL